MRPARRRNGNPVPSVWNVLRRHDFPLAARYNLRSPRHLADGRGRNCSNQCLLSALARTETLARGSPSSRPWLRSPSRPSPWLRSACSWRGIFAVPEGSSSISDSSKPCGRSRPTFPIARAFRPEISRAKCTAKLGPWISRLFRARPTSWCNRRPQRCFNLTARARPNSGHPKQLSSRCYRRPERRFSSRPYGLAGGPANDEKPAHLRPPPRVGGKRVHPSRSPYRGCPDGRAPRDPCHGHGAVDGGLEGGL